MAKEELSKAEAYRKERKDRLKKESKKNEKRNATVAKAKKVALKVIAVVVAIAIVFGVVVAVVNNTGSTFFRSKVASVGDYKISSVEFQYYYRTIYNQYYSYASQGYDMGGFDASKSPDEQKYTADDTTATPETTTAAVKSAATDETTAAETTSETTTTNYDTWNDFLADSTLKQIKNLVILAAEAEKAGIELSDTEKKDITDQMEEFRNSATENGYTLNAYLKLVYGDGVTERFMKKLMERDAIASKYTAEKQKEIANSYSKADIEKRYSENKQQYDYTDFRAQVFTVDGDKYTAETAKKAADEFSAKAFDENTFEAAADEILIADAIESAKTEAQSAATDGSTAQTVDEEAIKKEYKDNNKSSLKEKTDYSTAQQMGEDVAKWVFDSSRKAGDKTTVEVKTDGKVTSYVVIYMVKTAYRDEVFGKNVRHILFKFETAEESSEPTAEQKAAAKAKADAALKEWKSGEATEESFGKIASEKTEDTGSAQTGGLYENIVPGQMVETFNDWCFDESRKPGDTGIVESTYGYHVMYFVKTSERQIWEQTIRTEKAKDDYQKNVDTLSNSAEYELKINKSSYKSALKDAAKYVKQYLYNVSRNSQNAQQ